MKGSFLADEKGAYQARVNIFLLETRKNKLRTFFFCWDFLCSFDNYCSHRKGSLFLGALNGRLLMNSLIDLGIHHFILLHSYSLPLMMSFFTTMMMVIIILTI
jgi:hypothetical protein